MKVPLALIAALLAVPAAAQPRMRTYNWGQGDPLVIRGVFAKVLAAARREQPAAEAALELSESYLVSDAPASAATSGERPVVRVGKASLDAAQSESELAFLLAHELHHALTGAKKRACLSRGARAPGERAVYELQLEREADAWGQRYLAEAGFNALSAADAIRHVGDLAQALGSEPDAEHDSAAAREARLKAPAPAPYEARCPW